MTEKAKRCDPARQTHEFNGNALCECKAMRDDGTLVESVALEVPVPVVIDRAAGSLGGDAASSSSVSLEVAASIVAGCVREGLALQGDALVHVHDAMQAVLHAVRRA